MDWILLSIVIQKENKKDFGGIFYFLNTIEVRKLSFFYVNQNKRSSFLSIVGHFNRIWQMSFTKSQLWKRQKPKFLRKLDPLVVRYSWFHRRTRDQEQRTTNTKNHKSNTQKQRLKPEILLNLILLRNSADNKLGTCFSFFALKTSS